MKESSSTRKIAQEIFDKYYYAFPTKKRIAHGYSEAKVLSVMDVESRIEALNSANITLNKKVGTDSYSSRCIVYDIVQNYRKVLEILKDY